jgi:hypothetical protein
MHGILRFVLKWSLCIILYWKRTTAFFVSLLVSLILSNIWYHSIMFKGRITFTSKIFSSRGPIHRASPQPSVHNQSLYLPITESFYRTSGSENHHTMHWTRIQLPIAVVYSNCGRKHIISVIIVVVTRTMMDSATLISTSNLDSFHM